MASMERFNQIWRWLKNRKIVSFSLTSSKCFWKILVFFKITFIFTESNWLIIFVIKDQLNLELCGVGDDNKRENDEKDQKRDGEQEIVLHF